MKYTHIVHEEALIAQGTIDLHTHLTDAGYTVAPGAEVVITPIKGYYTLTIEVII